MSKLTNTVPMTKRKNGDKNQTVPLSLKLCWTSMGGFS